MLSDVGCSAAEQSIELAAELPHAGLAQRLVASGASVDPDRRLRDHCARVAELAWDIARARGFNERAKPWFRMGAMLHEAGEIALAAARLSWDIRPMIRHVHERWDGTGYPDRLEAAEIPLTARILDIADAFDELTATAHHGRCSPEQAIRIMARESGSRFDPELFRLFAKRILARQRHPVRIVAE